jgi:hypothetical protein
MWSGHSYRDGDRRANEPTPSPTFSPEEVAFIRDAIEAAHDQAQADAERKLTEFAAMKLAVKAKLGVAA